jgi:adenine nucleotide transporter 17
MASMALTYPLITVSTRAQVNKSNTTGAKAGQLEAFKKIIREEGVQGLYS